MLVSTATELGNTPPPKLPDPNHVVQSFNWNEAREQEAPWASVCVLDANDSTMSGAQEEMAAATAAQTSSLDVSSAALGLQDRTHTALFG